MNPAHYSYTWAHSVVSKLYSSYPRATDLVVKILGIRVWDLATFLAHNDEVFSQCRNLIHLADRLTKTSKSYYTDVWLKDNLLALAHQNGWERVERRLTGFPTRPILIEQGSRGVGEGGKADRPNQPYSRSLELDNGE